MQLAITIYNRSYLFVPHRDDRYNHPLSFTIKNRVHKVENRNYQ